MTRDTGWFKSTYSGAGNDNCVEVRLTPDTVRVRDSKAPTAGQVWLSSAAWTVLIRHVSTSS
jgi:hypothetical protein